MPLQSPIADTLSLLWTPLSLSKSLCSSIAFPYSVSYLTPNLVCLASFSSPYGQVGKKLFVKMNVI